MGKYRTIGTDLNRVYRNDLNQNFEDIDTDIKAGVAETKRVETETKNTIDSIVGGGFIEGLETARDRANTAAISADEKAALANAKATYANTQGLYAKEQGDYAKLQGNYAKDKALEADTAATNANAEASNLDGLKIAVTDATQAAGVSASKADVATVGAENATLAADTATGKADASTLKANTAADNADAKAMLAQTAAENANTEATGLETLKADVALATTAANDSALRANTSADTADTSAASADLVTAEATAQALEAQTQAAHAQTQGDFAKLQGEFAKIQGTHAKTEGDKAALANAEFITLKGESITATTNATDAALLANSEAADLATMKDAVTSATTGAIAVTESTALESAYAKAQGNYAKAKGDAVQDIFDSGLVASVNGKTGAVNLTPADVGAEPAVPGKSLSTEDFTTAEKTKLGTVEDGANNYTLPAALPAEMITESPTKRFVADTKTAEWDAAEQNAKDYADSKIADIPAVDLAPYATKIALKEEEAARLLHENKKIHEGELHGLRIVDDALEIFNGTEWLAIKGGGGGVPLGNVESLSATAEVGNKIKIAWTDPADVVLEGITLAKWSGTKLLRKEGTYPTNEKDGTVLADSKVRDAYAAGYSDTGLTAGTTYYYALFPYSENGLVTIDNTNRATAKAFEKYVKEAPSKPVASKLQQNKATVTSDVGAVVSLDKVDWFASPYEFTGLTDGQTYTPYAKVAATATHFESAIATGTAFIAVNKLPKTAPTEPVISAMKFDRATITSEAGAVVSINGTNWFPTPHEYTGLTAEQAYVAYAKFEESSTHLESPVSQKAFTTPSAVKIYGVKIDTTNSNPETAVTYTDDAIGSTPMKLQGGSISMGSWADRYPFSEITPVVVKNGVEQFELNPNDYTQKKAGGAADITSGAAGDVFVRFAPLWWKFETVGTALHIRIATAPQPGYKRLAHMKGSTELDFAYIGAYMGFNSGGQLRSLSGKVATATQTIGTFRTQAQAQGAGYTQFDYYKLLMVQVMLLIATKSRDSQTALGRGYVDGNAAYANTGGTDKKGLNFGETTGKMQNKIFGIEDFWGNYYQFIDGMVTDASHNMLIGNDNFNDTGAGYTNHGKGATANVAGYISTVQGGTETGFIVKEAAGSETTHYADYGYLNSGSLPIFGGDRADAGMAGAFVLRVYQAPSSSSADCAARACFRK